MKKPTKVKKITNALKRFVSKTPPSAPEQPDFEVTLMKLVERFAALERKTDLIFGQMSNLSMVIRDALKHFQRGLPSQTVQAPPYQAGPSYPSRSPQRPQAAPGKQSVPSPALNHAQPKHVSPELNALRLPQPTEGTSMQGSARGRRDRFLHKAICADCNKECEVPIKPTEGRSVYCKSCFVLRKAAKSLPVKNAEGNSALRPLNGRSQGSEPMTAPTMSPAAPGSLGHSPAISKPRTSSPVPVQSHNTARSHAVAYMAKKAGHLPVSQNTKPQTPSAPAVSSGPADAVRHVRPKSVRYDRSKPKKRTR